MQHLLFFYIIILLFISFKLTTLLTTINKGILVNDINFTIEINTINSQTLNHRNLEREGVFEVFNNIWTHTHKKIFRKIFNYLFYQFPRY